MTVLTVSCSITPAAENIWQPISLCDLVRENLPLLQQALNPSIHVETDMRSDVWKITADLLQMQTGLSALFSNAMEAMNEGGRIKIACRNEVVAAKKAESLPGLVPGAYVRMEIQDTGQGMDEETRKRVFEPFFTTKLRAQALGWQRSTAS